MLLDRPPPPPPDDEMVIYDGLTTPPPPPPPPDGATLDLSSVKRYAVWAAVGVGGLVGLYALWRVAGR